MKVGVIGGSGLYQMDGLERVQEHEVDTPFGRPSDRLVSGRISGIEVVFLARHGRGHVLLPSEINYRANIWAMKKMGVERVLSISAVGSFREELAPRDVVFVDQFVDRTRGRPHTFFGDGVAAHVAFSDPTCDDLRRKLFDVAERVLPTTEKGPAGRAPQAHERGTYLNMEGPQFSTRAESYLHKSWGMDVIGMTNMTEARLAREAELCYLTMAMVTDYDCWHDQHEQVSVELVVRTLLKNAETAATIVREAVPVMAKDRDCDCAHALENGIITAPDQISNGARRRLDLLIGRYLAE